jgi:hypothetical protein
VNLRTHPECFIKLVVVCVSQWHCMMGLLSVPERAVLSFVQAGEATVEPGDLAVGNCRETHRVSDRDCLLKASGLNVRTTLLHRTTMT